jgi:hypothetical protein
MWEEATPFDNQEGFTEPELFYINELLKKGFEVRFTEKHILHKTKDLSYFLSLQRINLVFPASERKKYRKF